jgi:glycosyltransferase involved in cell wall biosynthesis
MSPHPIVHLVVPSGIDDPLRPSGGNTYDRRLSETLLAEGWDVRLHTVSGTWPSTQEPERSSLEAALAMIGNRAVVVVDGLLASALPEVVVPASRRVRLVVLVHMLLGPGSDDSLVREGEVLRSAAAVVATSEWTRRQLVAAYGLAPEAVRVAAPGVDPAASAVGSSDGGGLLCVGAVTPAKGHDLLVAALAATGGDRWRCSCVGSLDVCPDFVTASRRRLRDLGLAGQVVLTGPITGAALDRAYREADVLVLTSRSESYGMVVTEALAHGLPVLAPAVGGVPEALGTSPSGKQPGLLTPPGDTAAFAGSLRRWLSDADLRAELRAAALDRRTTLAGWPETAARVARVLEEVAA